MTIDRSALEILLPLIESAREELADMEADDIAQGVRKAARSSARTLPPPLARSVVNELMHSDSFRSGVAERYFALSDPDEDLTLFLDRPVEAMERITERANALVEDDVRSDLDAASKRIRTLESQLAEAKRRNAALLARHVLDLDAARSSVSVAQVRAEDRIQKMAAAISVEQSEVSALKHDLVVLADELASAEERLASVVQKNRRRSEGGGHAGQQPRTDSTPSDPLELAIWLDGVERNVRPFRERGTLTGGRAIAEPLCIDPGVAPDSASALASLLDQHPARFLLDGYNIGGEIHADGFATRSARDDVIHRAGRLARDTEADVLVVFDGPDDEGRSGFRSAAGVIVRFSRGVKADDVIAGLVAADPERTVVITNDRDLRDRCSVDGCIPIWSTAFLEWL